MTDQGKTTEKRDRARVLHGQNGKCGGMTGKGAADPRNGREKHCKSFGVDCMAEPGEQKGEKTMNDTITMTVKQYEELINGMARFLAIKHYVGAENYLNPDVIKRLAGLEVKEEPAE